MIDGIPTYNEENPKETTSVVAPESGMQNDVRFQQPDVKKEIQNTTYDVLASALWDEVYYTSSFSSVQANSDDVGAPMSTSLRESDTSAGKHLSHLRQSRFRCMFYLLTGQDSSEVYIASPGTSQLSTVGSALKDSDKSFVGIKIENNRVWLVSYDRHTGDEEKIATNKYIRDDETHILEIHYFINSATIFLDREKIGNIKALLNKDATFETYFAFITSVESNTSTVTSLVIESYEFLQPRR